MILRLVDVVVVVFSSKVMLDAELERRSLVRFDDDDEDEDFLVFLGVDDLSLFVYCLKRKNC